MKLICPQCQTTYDVPAGSLGSGGREVRCARCQTVWLAEPSEPAVEVIPPTVNDVDATPPPSVVGAEPVVPNSAPAESAVTPSTADAGTAEPEIAPVDEETQVEDAPPAAQPDTDTPAAAAVTGDALPADPADADTEISTPAPKPKTAVAKVHAVAAAPLVDIESQAAREPAPPQPPKRRPGSTPRAHWLTAAIVVLAVIDAGLIIGRAEVVRVLPQTASLFESIGLPVNLRHLGFTDIKTAQELHDGVNILVVEGNIVATGQSTTDVPRLRFAINSANDREIYAWTALPARPKLAPGETLAFRTRLASPPTQGRAVKIRFFTRLDLATGLR